VQHRGQAVHDKKVTQAKARRRRHSANLRHRAPRFDNRKRPVGWLPPSIWNRARFAVEKTHALDALCVGELAGVQRGRLKTLTIMATGRPRGIRRQRFWRCLCE
jgi:hypothetical protein